MVGVQRLHPFHNERVLQVKAVCRLWGTLGATQGWVGIIPCSGAAAGGGWGHRSRVWGPGGGVAHMCSWQLGQACRGRALWATLAPPHRTQLAACQRLLPAKESCLQTYERREPQTTSPHTWFWALIFILYAPTLDRMATAAAACGAVHCG